MSPNFPSRSRIFRTHATGGGSGSSTGGTGLPTFASRSNVFTVPKTGGGALFEHGVIVGVDYVPVWDTDGYLTDPDWEGALRVPVGLGGIYLLLANATYSGASGASGFWGTCWNVANPEGSPTDSGPVGQWQQGYRALQTLSAGGGINMAWIGEVVEGAVLDVHNFTGGCGPTDFHVQHLSGFRLGAVGEEGFHGALTYGRGAGWDAELMGATALFDTDGYLTEPGFLWVPSDLGGLYLYCTTWTFKVNDINDWLPDPPTFPYGFDIALIPWMGLQNNHGLQDNAYNIWPCQNEIGAANIVDCAADVNEIAVTSFWIGRMPGGAGCESIIIEDDIAPHGGITINADPAMSYMALVRIAS